MSFTKDTYNKDEPIIIYGASVYGELAYLALERLGLTPTYFCDRSKSKKEYFGIGVINPDMLEDFREANILIASADFFHEIKQMLEEQRCLHLFDMAELLDMDLPREKMSNRALEMYANKRSYIDIVKNQSKGDLIFNRIQFVVTERCSLKCLDCSHLMQYYQQPQDFELCKYKEAFDCLVEQADYIAELRILGGEPFMNRDMGKVIAWYHDNRKIQSISVYTNGTIVPGEDILRELQKDNVKVHISNYGINEEQIKKTVKVFEEKNIEYFVRRYDSWQDTGSIAYRNYTLEEKKEIFGRCFERNGYAFLKGKLYRCPRVAHAMNLHAMPDVKEDYVDLLNWNGTKEELKKQLKSLQGRLWLEGCNYCGGPDNHTQSIPAARQISKPIVYETIDT